MNNRYAPHEQYVLPAQEKSEPWRILCVLALGFAGGLFVFQFVLAMFGAMFGADAPVTLLGEPGLPSTPVQTVFSLLSYGFFLIALLSAVRMLHDRGLRSLIGSQNAVISMGLRAFFASCAVLLLVMIVLPTSYDLSRSDVTIGQWLTIMPVIIVGVLVQAGSEEIVFRGYLQQQMAAWINHPVAWIGVPAVVFGLAHYHSAAEGNLMWFIGWAILFGILTADLTARTGNLGAAIGLHVAQNFFAFAVTSIEGNSVGTSLYSVPLSLAGPEVPWLIVLDAGVLILSWLAVRNVLRV